MKALLLQKPNLLKWLLVLVVFLAVGLAYGIHALAQPVALHRQESGVRGNAEANGKDVATAATTVHVPILMYHHVGSLPPEADNVRRDLTVSPEAFEAQLRWLSGQGYEAVSLEQIYLATQGQLLLPKKPVVFTFDDGYADVFLEAVPLLSKYSYVGSFAVVPGFFGQEDYATWEMVEKAKTVGMEIISHTHTHFDGSNKKFDVIFITQDLQQSLLELDAHLGQVSRILVYPYGHYTDEYVGIAKQTGFVMGLTTAYGQYVHPDTLMTTPRVRVHGAGSLDKFIETLTGIKQASTK